MSNPPKKPSAAADYPLQDAVSLAVDAATETVLGTTAGVGFKFISTLARRFAERKAEAMFQAAVEAWATIHQLDAPVAELEMQRLLRDGEGDTNDRLYEMFRQLAAARTDAAFPYIAKLTAPLIYGEGAKPDTFFRRASRLLERCEEEDVAYIEGACAVTRASLADFRRDHGALVEAYEGYKWVPNPEQMLVVTVSPPDERSPLRQYQHALGLDRSEMVARLLLDANLGREHPEGLLIPFATLNPLLSLFAGRGTP